MLGTMMNYPLTLTHILERAGRLFPEARIVSRLPDRSCIVAPTAISIAELAFWRKPCRKRVSSAETGSQP